MRVSLFDFDLPEDRIALRPAEPRDAARMLVVPPADAPFVDAVVADLPAWLRAGDALVVNDTRVLPARLEGRRQRGPAVARIEATLHLREAPDQWRAFLRPAKKIREGETIAFFADGVPETLDARVVSRQEGEALLHFAHSGAALDAALARYGRMPLPPYIASKRGEDDRDARDYQTLFAAHDGAVAAPTAGLHFTPRLIAALEAKGVGLHRVTLHVGAGTFLPVKVEDTDAHVMHAERGHISAATADALNGVRASGGRIVAVGTTSLRILESAAQGAGVIAPYEGLTSIFITPGHAIRSADMLLTNFHLPRSTLFMLACAFAGTARMKEAYDHAIKSHYRFYSYGDACLLHRA